MSRSAAVHPGEILLEEFLKPLGISPTRLALELRVPANRILAIVHGERSVTADTALRLARAFNTSAQFWLNLQMRYDLDMVEEAVTSRIESEVRPLISA
ncbi:MAG TPA: HigA family addiction module antitoxin [Oscillatoriaceae cyanobacterium]